MKREIEFRGKRIDNGEWVYGDLEYSRIADAAFIHTYGPTKAYAGQFRVDPETVGQYVGEKDKDGNRIFEGDVVECVSWNEYFSDPTTGKVMEPFRRRMEVVFMAGGFKLVEHLPQPCKDNVWNMIVEGDLTVIGNIHDNPELLEGGKQ